MRAIFFALTAALWGTSLANGQEAADSSSETQLEDSPQAPEEAAVGSDLGSEIERVDPKEKGAAPETENADPVTEDQVNPEESKSSEAPKPDEAGEVSREETPPSSETQPSEPQGPAPEAKAVEKEEPAKQEQKEEVSTDRYHSDFGSFRFSIGGGRPDFSNDLRFYNDLYGREKIHPDLFFDYYLLDWYISLGAGVHTRYYRAQGHASRSSNPGAGGISSDSIDKDSNLELVLIPIQALALLEITPWKTSFFTINGWAGHEQMYVQESRLAGASSSSNGASGSSSYVNRGWNQGRVVGASLSLRMDFLEPTASRSLEILGFRSVLITPYVEKSTTTKTKIAKFDRTTMGVVFTFESAY